MKGKCSNVLISHDTQHEIRALITHTISSDLEFDNLVSTVKVMSSQLVNPQTLFLCRLGPLGPLSS